MATATFDRTFVIDSQESADKLLAIMNSRDKVQPVDEVITAEELEKNGELLHQWLYH